MIKKIKFVIIILFFSFIFFVFFKGLDKPNSYLPKKNITEIETSLVFKNLYDQKEIVLGDFKPPSNAESQRTYHVSQQGIIRT